MRQRPSGPIASAGQDESLTGPGMRYVSLFDLSPGGIEYGGPGTPSGSGPFPGSNGPFRPFPFAFRPVCEMAAATLRMVSRLLGLGQEVAKRIRFD